MSPGHAVKLANEHSPLALAVSALALVVIALVNQTSGKPTAVTLPPEVLVQAAQLENISHKIDKMDAKLDPLTSRMTAVEIRLSAVEQKLGERNQ